MPDKVTVTVDDTHLSSMTELVARLRNAGMKVDRVLGGVGVITGSLPVTQRDIVQNIPGVAAVEEETSFQLPPPDSDIQ